MATIYAVSEILSSLVKGNISALMFACIIFLIGFWTDVLPDNITTNPGLTAVMTNFGVALLITNLGTLIDLETLISEWKTVVIALLGLVGVAAASFTVSALLFTREYALTAAPPIAGGTVATLIVQEAANLAGRPEMGAFAILVLSFEKFIGMPGATFGLKKELQRKLAAGDFAEGAQVAGSKLKLPSMRIFKPMPAKYNTPTMYLCKLAVVALLANIVGTATLIPGSNPANYWLNPNIAYLLFGLIFTRIGFLEKSSLQKSQSYGITMLGVMMMLPGSFAKVTPAGLLEMIVPLVGTLVVGGIAVCIVSALTGKVLRYSPFVACAIGITCMLGYPATEILANESVKNMETDDDGIKERALAYVMPKMIVGGFVTVTIASVAFAAVIAPMIFS